MPITRSAAKALRQSRRRREQNLARSKAYKEAAKKFKRLIAENKKDEAAKFLPTLYKTLDKAAKTNVIHKNKAARLKSRLAKRLSAVIK